MIWGYHYFRKHPCFFRIEGQSKRPSFKLKWFFLKPPMNREEKITLVVPNISLCHTRYWLHDTDHKFTSSAENPQNFSVDFVTPLPSLPAKEAEKDKSMNAIYVKCMSSNFHDFSEFFGLDVHFILQKLYILRQWGALICISFHFSQVSMKKDWLISSGPPQSSSTISSRDQRQQRQPDAERLRDRNSWEAKGPSQYHPPPEEIRPS